MHRIVILGGGTGGTIAANRLHAALGPETAITVIDRDDDHLYQPGLLFVPFGQTTVAEITRPRRRQLHRGIECRINPVEGVDISSSTVVLEDGTHLPYDVLVVATGAVLAPEETPGMLDAGWNERVFTFYSAQGATALAAALERFEGGRLVVNTVDMPIKCPVAPLEFCFLADWFFTQRGMRDRVDIVYSTPLDGAFTKPVASQRLGGMLQERRIDLVTEFSTCEVDGGSGRLSSYDDRTIDFDLAVVVPAHNGAGYVTRSDGLGDVLGFVPSDEHTLQTHAAPDIFVIGDAAALPASKAGSVTHFEGQTLVENVGRFLRGQTLDSSYDGHANCFIETGFSKAMLIDFNYDKEPVPGRFPGPVGLPLMRESHLNHLGKLLFEWFYWHALLPGRDIPGVHSAMPLSGKDFAASTGEVAAR